MVKFTHKTLAQEGNDLYRNPSRYFGALGLTERSVMDSPNLTFVRKEGDFIVFVNGLKYCDIYTDRKARLIGFEGNQESIRQFIEGLDGLILPYDGRLD